MPVHVYMEYSNKIFDTLVQASKVSTQKRILTESVALWKTSLGGGFDLKIILADKSFTPREPQYLLKWRTTYI